MKLINKTQRYYLLLIIGLLLVWGVAFLFFISSELSESVEEELTHQLHTIISELKSQKADPKTFPNTQFIELHPIPEVQDATVTYADTLLADPEDGEMEPFRQISKQVEFGGQPFRLVLRESQIEQDDLLTSILIAQIIFIVLLIGIVALLNRKLFNRIWQPFYDTVHQLTSYDISKKNSVNFKETDIEEFQQLNEVVDGLLKRIENDYRRLKQFTENASHEMQTPLSVIQNQIELLFQQQDLPTDQRKRLHQIKSKAAKLSRLNKALLLLTKIENEQYAKKEKVNISQLLDRLISEYRELATSKEISMDHELEPGIIVEMNPDLAEMLFRNLLSNAIKHNHQGGSVDIRLTGENFIISNTGSELTKDPSILFNRFQKGKESSDSLGLGLSIVYSIVVANSFGIDYGYQDQTHTVRLVFK